MLGDDYDEHIIGLFNLKMVSDIDFIPIFSQVSSRPAPQ